MPCGLSFVGIVWNILSFVSVSLACVGYFMPFWLSGNMDPGTPCHMNTFRRCNYPMYDDTGNVKIVFKCGHYSTFYDIPSLWWQIGTVVIGVGCAILLGVFFLGLLGCCMDHVVTKVTSRVAGSLQMTAGKVIILH